MFSLGKISRPWATRDKRFVDASRARKGHADHPPNSPFAFISEINKPRSVNSARRFDERDEKLVADELARQTKLAGLAGTSALHRYSVTRGGRGASVRESGANLPLVRQPRRRDN